MLQIAPPPPTAGFDLDQRSRFLSLATHAGRWDFSLHELAAATCLCVCSCEGFWRFGVVVLRIASCVLW